MVVKSAFRNTRRSSDDEVAMKIFVTAAILSLLAAAPRPASAPTSPPSPKLNCGEASWTITDQKAEKTIFNGTAACTKVESNGWLTSIFFDYGPSLVIRFEASGESHCSNAGRVDVTLSGVKAPTTMDNTSYTAGSGNPPPPGSSCEFSIADFPHRPGLVRGSLKAVLGRCVIVGGCGKPSDWDLATVNGSFEAYYRGD
jgi:hypothetical protein